MIKRPWEPVRGPWRGALEVIAIYTPERHCAFFQNRACEYFPCHETDDPERFNCLFCYCPLYALGRRCGGDFRYTPGGVKDCTGCLFPHRPESYARILARYPEIMALMRESDARSGED